MYLSWLYLQLFLCGIFHASDAVDFGEIAEEGEFPYLAFISISQKTESSWCGGAILDETHILTTAHCVTNDLAPVDHRSVKVIVDRIWVHRLWSREFSIAKITVHPKYRLPKCPGCVDRLLAKFCIKTPISDYYKAKNDIAVLTMEEPLPMSQNVQKIDYLYNDPLPYGETCKLAGWGLNSTSDELVLSHELKWISLKILNASDCATLQFPSSPGDFCARDVEKEAMTLLGDSGSPLVCHGVLVGLLSMGCGERGYPDIFVDVQYHDLFITKALGKKSCKRRS